MIDVNKLLTAVLSGGAEQNDRRDAARPGRFLQSGRAAGQAGGGAPGGAPFGLPQFFGQGAPESGGVGDFLSRNAGMLGGGAVAGGLAGVLLNSKHVRRYAGTALQVGAAAVLGGLAYKAFQDYRAGRPVLPQGLSDAIKQMLPQGAGLPTLAPDANAAPSADPAQDRTATLLLRAMIASAMADGRIDETERLRLIERVEASALTHEEREFLEGLIALPDRPESLAADVTSPEEAAQVYLAAFIAIDADTPDERAWLDDLAGRLRLDPQLRVNVETAGRASLDQAA